MVFYLGGEKTGHAGWWARGAVLGADLAALSALGRVGRGIRSAKRGLGLGFGRAGRAAWDLAVLGAFGSARRAGLGWAWGLGVLGALG